MHKTQADFNVETKNNTAVRVGKSSVLIPKTNFAGGQMKWYSDKPKKVHKSGV